MTINKLRSNKLLLTIGIIGLIAISIFLAFPLLIALYIRFVVPHIPYIPPHQDLTETIEPINKKFTISEYLKYADLKCEDLLIREDLIKINNNPSRTCMEVLTQRVNNAPLKIKQLSNLQIPRANPEIIPLNNGNALIVGGDSSNSIELYDNSLKTFKTIGINGLKINNNLKQNICYPFLYLKNQNIFYHELIFDQHETKFIKSSKTLENKCQQFSNDTVIANTEI